MFISKAEKQDIHSKLELLENAVANLTVILEKLLEPAPYGRCKDGTPRMKPGRKGGGK
jgi:hypothetical protein